MHLIHLTSVDSTQFYAKRWLAEQAECAPTAILADAQTQGKGQWNRGWTSLPGNLFATYVVPTKMFPDAQNFPSMGLRVAEALCHELSNYPLHIKWPNDLFLHGQKCGGILCEVESEHFLIGVGLNVVDAPDGKSCLNQHTPYHATTYALCQRLGERIVNINFTSTWQLPPLVYQNEWIDYTPPKGEPFDVHVEGLSSDGTLMVRGRNGIPITLSAGRLGLAGTRT